MNDNKKRDDGFRQDVAVMDISSQSQTEIALGSAALESDVLTRHIAARSQTLKLHWVPCTGFPRSGKAHSSQVTNPEAALGSVALGSAALDFDVWQGTHQPGHKP